MVQRALYQEIVDNGMTGTKQTISGAATTELLEVTNTDIVRGKVGFAILLDNIVFTGGATFQLKIQRRPTGGAYADYMAVEFLAVDDIEIDGDNQGVLWCAGYIDPDVFDRFRIQLVTTGGSAAVDATGAYARL